MTTQTPGFDPRYDPAYQRGFDVAPPAQSPAVEHAVPAEVPPSGERPQSGDGASSGEPLAVVEPAETPTDPASRAPFELDSAVAPVPLRGNPWVIALWVVSAALTMGGIALQWQAQQFFLLVTGSDATSYALQSLYSSIGPWFTLVGLVAGVGVMFLHASRWRAKP